MVPRIVLDLETDEFNGLDTLGELNDLLPSVDGESFQDFKIRLNQVIQTLKEDQGKVAERKRSIFIERIKRSQQHEQDLLSEGNEFRRCMKILDEIAVSIPDMSNIAMTLSSVYQIEKAKRMLELEVSAVQRIQRIEEIQASIERILNQPLKNATNQFLQFKSTALDPKTYIDLYKLCETGRKLLLPFESLREYNALSRDLFARMHNILENLKDIFKQDFSRSILISGEIKNKEICSILGLMLEIFSHAEYKSYREELKSAYIQKQLEDYTNTFKPIIVLNSSISNNNDPNHKKKTKQRNELKNSGISTGDVESFFNRCQWLEKRLNLIKNDHRDIFPKSWNIMALIAFDVVMMLYKDLNTLLSSIFDILPDEPQLNPQDTTQIKHLVSLKQIVDTLENNLKNQYEWPNAHILSKLVEDHLVALLPFEQAVIDNLLACFKNSKDRRVAMSSNLLESSDLFLKQLLDALNRVGSISKGELYARTSKLILNALHEYASQQSKLLITTSKMFSKKKLLFYNASIGSSDDIITVDGERWIKDTVLALHSIEYMKQELFEMEKVILKHLTLYEPMEIQAIPFEDTRQNLEATLVQLKEFLELQIETCLESLFKIFSKSDWHSDPIGDDIYTRTVSLKKIYLCLKQLNSILESHIFKYSHNILSMLLNLLGRLFYQYIWKCSCISCYWADQIQTHWNYIKVIFEKSGLASSVPAYASKDQLDYIDNLFTLLKVKIDQNDLETSGPSVILFMQQYRQIYSSGDEKHLSSLLELRGIKKGAHLSSKWIELS
jgi:hypothetical protein